MSSLFASNDKQNLVVIYSNGKWVTIDTETNDVIGTSRSFSFSENDGWVTTLPQHATTSLKKLKIYFELAEGASTSLVVKEVSDDNFSFTKSFRVPKAVKAEGKFTDDTATLRAICDYTDDPKFNLIPEPPVTLAWVRNIRDKHPIPERVLTAAGFIPDPKSVYFGVPVDVDTPFIMTGLIQYNESTEEWTVRNPEHWDPIHENDLPEFLIELDEDSAAQLASWIDGSDDRSSDTIEFSFSDVYPEESGVFFAAEAELDMELLDRVFDIYDSQERSVNAKKQVRGQGGRFGPGGKSSPTQEKPVQKARLPYSLPLVEDIPGLIDQFLADVARQRVKSEEKPDQEFAVSAEASGVDVTDVAPLYLAIVDDIDPDAVLDVVALVPPKRGAQGDVSAWKRDNGQWISAPELLQQLRGSTPPSVVKLEDEELVKNVLEQVDKSTAVEAEEAPVPGATEVDAEGEPVVASVWNIIRGYAYIDGSLTIRTVDDLKKAIYLANDEDQEAHVVKRARALNRLDLIPHGWDVTEFEAPDLWGPYGELIAAGGADRSRGNAERLRRYWTTGPGGAKIRWKTGGDWKRCFSHLSKYLGPRAKGYCALRHHEMNGYWPGDKKNLS